MKRALVLFAFSLVCCASCESWFAPFSGITETDSYGNTISSDNDDWDFNDSWSKKELALFSEGLDEGCIIEGNLSAAAYPNPCNSIFNLAFVLPEGKWLDIRIVNSDYDILYEKDSLTLSRTMQIEVTGYSNEIIRVYYRIQDSSCELKGHGDILIEE